MKEVNAKKELHSTPRDFVEECKSSVISVVLIVRNTWFRSKVLEVMSLTRFLCAILRFSILSQRFRIIFFGIMLNNKSGINCQDR